MISRTGYETRLDVAGEKLSPHRHSSRARRRIIMSLPSRVVTHVLIIPLLFFAALPTAVNSARQSSERAIEQRHVRGQPAEVVEIRNKKLKLVKASKIEDGDDWLEGLSVSVKNTSAKAITYVEVGLEFPKADDLSATDDRILAFNLYYGTREKPDGSGQRPSIKPGEVTQLTLSDERYELLQGALSSLNYSKSIKKIKLAVRVVIFEDDIMWNFGTMMSRDPDDPHRWVRIGQSRTAPPKPPTGKPKYAATNAARQDEARDVRFVMASLGAFFFGHPDGRLRRRVWHYRVHQVRSMQHL